MTIEQFFRSAIDLLPRSELVFRACRRYVNRYNSENDGDMHSNGEYWWMRKVIPESRVAFDVGANVGDWTAMALELNPELIVHCFEPSPTTFRKLTERNLPPDNAILNNFGLASQACVAKLHIYGDGIGANSLFRREGLDATQTTTEEVQLETLDDYCRSRNVDHIDTLKIDVEGYELNVLKGSQDMLSTGRITRIQFEYGGTYIDSRILLKDVFELLSDNRYNLYKLFPNAAVRQVAYRQEFENFQYQNWVAVLAK